MAKIIKGNNENHVANKGYIFTQDFYRNLNTILQEIKIASEQFIIRNLLFQCKNFAIIFCFQMVIIVLN